MSDKELWLWWVVSVLGINEGPDCCDIEGGGRISPIALISVVGETGAGVLNSNARYEGEEWSVSEEGNCNWKLDVDGERAVVEFVGLGRNLWCLKLVARPVVDGDFPQLTGRTIRWWSWLRSFSLTELASSPLEGFGIDAWLLVEIEGKGFIWGRTEVRERGEVLDFDGEDDRERSERTGWLSDDGGAPLRAFLFLDLSDRWMSKLSPLVTSISSKDEPARLSMDPTVSTFARTSLGIAYDDTVCMLINKVILVSWRV